MLIVTRYSFSHLKVQQKPRAHKLSCTDFLFINDFSVIFELHDNDGGLHDNDGG